MTGIALQELRARNMSCEHEKHLHKDWYKNFMGKPSGQRSKRELRQILGKSGVNA
jgi:hypothetical protein